MRRLLRDEPLVSPQELFTAQQTLPHGHVQAVLRIIRKPGLAALLSAKRCRERDLVVAMITQRLLDPCSKLATTRAWHTSTLAEELGVEEATEDDLSLPRHGLAAGQEGAHRKEAGPASLGRGLFGPL